MLWKVVVIAGVLLSLFPFDVEGKAIEGEIVIPIPFVSNQLFDRDVKKNDEVPSPDSDPRIEAINREARKEYHLAHPTWKEFFSFE